LGSIDFGVHISNGNLRIDVAAHGAGACDFARAPVVAEIRARLQALYGERASLDVALESGVSASARLVIPHERV
jgi:hypothetical protein